MPTETKILRNKWSHEGEPKINIHETEYLTLKARTCLDMISRWGMVAAISGEEDSAGRATLRLQEVEEVVARAILTTQEMFDAFETEGWIHHLPTFAEAEEIAKKQESNLSEPLDKVSKMLDNALEKSVKE